MSDPVRTERLKLEISRGGFDIHGDNASPHRTQILEGLFAVLRTLGIPGFPGSIMVDRKREWDESTTAELAELLPEHMADSLKIMELMDEWQQLDTPKVRSIAFPLVVGWTSEESPVRITADFQVAYDFLLERLAGRTDVTLDDLEEIAAAWDAQ